MEKFSLFSEGHLKEWLAALEDCHDHLLHADIQLDRKHLIPESEICTILGVTERTMRRYRKKKYFRYIKLDGRIYYLRLMLYIDLVQRAQGADL